MFTSFATLQCLFLSREVITKLNLLAKVNSVNDVKKRIIAQYPTVFSGLDCMKDSNTLHLKVDALPYAIHAPRRIPAPILPKVKKELNRQLRLGIISNVDKPTKLCAQVTVVSKSTSFRLCIKLPKFNDSVLRERHILPTTDQTLALLADAKVFTKLDCNSAFLQIPLSPDSQLLTTFILPMGHFCFR